MRCQWTREELTRHVVGQSVKYWEEIDFSCLHKIKGFSSSKNANSSNNWTRSLPFRLANISFLYKLGQIFLKVFIFLFEWQNTEGTINGEREYPASIQQFSSQASTITRDYGWVWLNPRSRGPLRSSTWMAGNQVHGSSFTSSQPH